MVGNVYGKRSEMSNPEKRVYEHFIVGEFSRLWALAEHLQRSGFSIDLRAWRDVEDREDWSCFLNVYTDFERLEILGIEEMAEEFDCEWRGGGCYVGPLESLNNSLR